MHQFHAGQAQNVGNFVGVDKHAGGAVGNDSAGKFRHGDHAAFDVHVGVAQAGDEVTAVRRNNFRVFPDGVAGIRADVGDTAAFHRHVRLGDDFAAVDVDPTAVLDHEIGALPPHRHIHQIGCYGVPRLSLCCHVLTSRCSSVFSEKWGVL